MHSTSLRVWIGRIAAPCGAALLTTLAAACGGGGGGGSSAVLHGDTSDPVLPLVGNPGTLSQTPEVANLGAGTAPPPSYDPVVTTTSHWFRIEFPFVLDRNSILSSDPLFAPFSTLNGNITVTDNNGEHIPGMAMVNGVDAFGVRHNADTGFPHDVQSGVDKNVGPGVFLYVADLDGSLATAAAWGWTFSSVNPSLRIETQTASVDTLRISVSTVNGWTANASWTSRVGTTADTQAPFVVSVASETKDPTDPTNVNSTASTGTFIVQFSEPMVPQSVGHSALLNGFPFDGNQPLPPFIKPLPDTTIMATLNTSAGTLFVPFDCNPVNSNNLMTYRFSPLVDLPSKSSVDVLIRAVSNNVNGTTLQQRAAIDLSGNFFDGPDADNNGVPDKTDVTASFSVGPGRAVANVPVSPEVVYWLPSVGDGIGAIDLNGWGYTTNTPGANAGIRERASIITKAVWDLNHLTQVNPEGMDPFVVPAIALLGHPGFEYDRYLYPIGTGALAYGFGITTDWEGLATDLGNSGTQFPGINEMSSGFETICRDSSGSPVLTGAQFGDVGNIQDLIVGEFLDRVFYDRANPFANNVFHVSIFGGHAATLGRNTIADPPTPNPPPTRYWAGLPQLGIAIDQENPTLPPQMIESDEVFTGDREFNGPNRPGNATHVGFQQLRVNNVNPNAADLTIFPHRSVGPGTRSATAAYTFSARQQIGNFLYATDATTHELQVINSNTMRLISSLSLPDPTGLGISPDMSYLFVTNFADNTLSVVGADPTKASFHTEIARVQTGLGPKSIAVQPENEDIFVCDFLGNTVSIINPSSLTIRKQLTSLINGPYDVEVTERQEQPSFPHPFGWASGIYFAYISNFTGNSVVVYESGPAGPQGIGVDNVRGSLPTGDNKPPLIAPRGLCFSPFANPSGLFAGGVFIAHQDDQGFGRVSHIQFTQQAIYGPLPVQVPPGYFIPPGFTDRQFEVTGSWGDTDASRLAGHQPTDVSLSDLTTASYQAKPSGPPNFGGVGVPPAPEQTGFTNSKNHMRLAPQAMGVAWVPDRLYVSFQDSDEIQVLDPASAGVIVQTIAGHGQQGTKKLCSFWRQ
jgi:hypothetical protein